MAGKALAASSFALRCALASTLAFGIAAGLGLEQALWAALSAVIVSQDKLSDTRASLLTRVAGTALGAAIAVVVGLPGLRLGAPPVLQTAIGVALAAALAHLYPALRVAMWTCPIVLLTGDGAQPLVDVALRRAAEVGLGAVVGWATHWAAAKLTGEPPAPKAE